MPEVVGPLSFLQRSSTCIVVLPLPVAFLTLPNGSSFILSVKGASENVEAEQSYSVSSGASPSIRRTSSRPRMPMRVAHHSVASRITKVSAPA